jgi:hypothetical protein
MTKAHMKHTIKSLALGLSLLLANGGIACPSSEHLALMAA